MSGELECILVSSLPPRVQLYHKMSVRTVVVTNIYPNRNVSSFWYYFRDLKMIIYYLALEIFKKLMKSSKIFNKSFCVHFILIQN